MSSGFICTKPDKDLQQHKTINKRNNNKVTCAYTHARYELRDKLLINIENAADILGTVVSDGADRTDYCNSKFSNSNLL